VRTLIVNCYREKAEEKIKGYVAQAERFTDVNEVPWGVLEPAYDVETYSAVIISGSQWLLSIESPPAPLVEFVRDLKVPTLGICFGHQLFARAFGTQVLSGELIERDETVLISEPGPLFYGMGPELDFLESHREYVVAEPIERAGWHIIARSASCPVEAMHHPTRPLYGVQFHPERSGVNGEKLFDNFYHQIVFPFVKGTYQHQFGRPYR
jgi:GMP synthase-like glutamine amidotransferase